MLKDAAYHAAKGNIHPLRRILMMYLLRGYSVDTLSRFAERSLKIPHAVAYETIITLLEH